MDLKSDENGKSLILYRTYKTSFVSLTLKNIFSMSQQSSSIILSGEVLWTEKDNVAGQVLITINIKPLSIHKLPWEVWNNSMWQTWQYKFASISELQSGQANVKRAEPGLSPPGSTASKVRATTCIYRTSAHTSTSGGDIGTVLYLKITT